MIDTHVHLSHYKFRGSFPYLAFEDGKCVLKGDGRIDKLIDEMKSNDIDFVIEPAISIESCDTLLALSRKYSDFIYPAVGVHPTRTYKYATASDEKKLSFSQMKKLKEIAKEPDIIAIGETGLDYHHDRKEQHRIRQKIWFIYQIHLAKKKTLPLILHIRNAHSDALHILKFFKKQLNGGVCHCYTGNYDTAKKYISLGFKIGIGASLLCGNEELEDAVRRIPAESIILETDSPYVKPPHEDIPAKKMRNARNTSLILPQVISKIAELRGIEADDVISFTSENTYDAFPKLKSRHTKQL